MPLAKRQCTVNEKLLNSLAGHWSEDVLLPEKCFTFTQKIQHQCDRNWLAIYIPVGVSKEYVARELNQTDYGDFPSVSRSEQKYSPQTALCTVAVTRLN